MAEFLNDTFIAGSDTALESHTSDSGGGWAKITGIATGLTVDAAVDAVKGDSAASTGMYRSTEVPGSANYTVTGICSFTTLSLPHAGVMARCSSSANTLYQFYYGSNSGGLLLQKHVNGTPTLLGSVFSWTPSTDTDYEFILDVNGDQITGTVTGVGTIGPITDTDISNAGFAGVRTRADGRVKSIIAVDDVAGGNVTATSIGIESAVALGSVTAAGGALVVQTGVQGNGALGSAAVDLQQSASVAGVEAPGVIGISTCSISAIVNVNAPDAAAMAGSVAVSFIDAIEVSGCLGNTQVGSILLHLDGVVPLFQVPLTSGLGTVLVRRGGWSPSGSAPVVWLEAVDADEGWAHAPPAGSGWSVSTTATDSWTRLQRANGEWVQ